VWKPGIARSLVFFILLVSSLITLLVTCFQLYRDYTADLNQLEEQLDQLELSFSKPLAEALWTFDYSQVAVNLEGIVRLPDIAHGRVVAAADGKQIEVGQAVQGRSFEKVLELSYDDHGRLVVVGRLEVEATLENILARLRSKAWLVLVAQAIQTFLVALFLFVLLDRLVIRHLETIAHFAKNLRLDKPEPLLLHRPQLRRDDEFEEVVRAFQLMQRELSASYKHLLESNLELDGKTRELEQHRTNLQNLVEVRTSALKQAQQRLVESARRSGMAEIAASTLHNVGNALNSLNVSSQLLLEQMAHSRVESLGRASEVLRQTLENLAPALPKESKVDKLGTFFLGLTEQLRQERLILTKELQNMQKQIETVRKAVQAQESYADFDQPEEPTLLAELVDQVIAINEASLSQKGILLQRELDAGCRLSLPKSRIHYVIAHLIHNAIDALVRSNAAEPRLSVSLRRSNACWRLSIADNGCGIAPEDLPHIFEYGFTSKPGSQGVGLHLSANTMHEIGGQLLAESEGLGLGATFHAVFPG
jgi:signal transduction histidine kinase